MPARRAERRGRALAKLAQAFGDARRAAIGRSRGSPARGRIGRRSDDARRRELFHGELFARAAVVDHGPASLDRDQAHPRADLLPDAKGAPLLRALIVDARHGAVRRDRRVGAAELQAQRALLQLFVHGGLDRGGVARAEQVSRPDHAIAIQARVRRVGNVDRRNLRGLDRARAQHGSEPRVHDRQASDPERDLEGSHAVAQKHPVTTPADWPTDRARKADKTREIPLESMRTRAPSPARLASPGRFMDRQQRRYDCRIPGQ